MTGCQNKKGSFLLHFFVVAGSAQFGTRALTPVAVPSEERFNFFDSELLQEVCSTAEGNVLISPVSIKTILLMILEGSVGESAKQLQFVLRLSENKDFFRKRIQLFMKSLQKNTPDYTVQIANRLFISEDLQLNTAYLDALKTYYLSDYRQVNFPSQEITATTINDWINGTTHGFIPKLVDAESLPPNAKLVLANGIYFKGKWKLAFDIDGTTERNFHLDSENTQKAYFMESLSYYKYAYIDKLDAKSVEIFYAGEKYSMLILMPNRVGGIQQLVRDLPHFSLMNVVNSLHLTEIFLSIPRFKISFVADLIPALETLGITEIFGTGANLSGIYNNTGPSFISKILHSAKIDVNEEGTVAGAGTGALVVPLMGTTIPRFRADRPFLFFIRDLETGNILFGGRVSKPDEAITVIKHPVIPQLQIGLESKFEETTEHVLQSVGPPSKSNIQNPPKTNVQKPNGNGMREYLQKPLQDKDAIQFTSRGT